MLSTPRMLVCVVRDGRATCCRLRVRGAPAVTKYVLWTRHGWPRGHTAWIATAGCHVGMLSGAASRCFLFVCLFVCSSFVSTSRHGYPMGHAPWFRRRRQGQGFWLRPKQYTGRRGGHGARRAAEASAPGSARLGRGGYVHEGGCSVA
jgi:hypothetical protein